MKAKLLELLKKGWPYLAVLALGVGIGWALKPDQVRIEEKTKLVEKINEVRVVDEVLVKAEVERRVKEIESKMKTRVVTVWVEKPDGTKTTTKTEEAETDTKVKEDTTKTTDTVDTKKEVDAKVVYRDVETIKVVEPVKTQWMVGVAVGASVRLDNLAASPIMVGVSAKRRILGPFFLGVQAMAGSPVTGFQVSNPTFLLTGDAEF